MRLCQMGHSEEQWALCGLNSASGALILAPAVPPPLLVLEGRGGVQGPGNRKEVGGITGCCPQVLLEQPFHPSARLREGEWDSKGKGRRGL